MCQFQFMVKSKMPLMMLMHFYSYQKYCRCFWEFRIYKQTDDREIEVYSQEGHCVQGECNVVSMTMRLYCVLPRPGQ